MMTWTLVPAALVAAAASAWWLAGGLDARHWPIRWLEVSGELERVTAAQVRAAVADEARQGFFAVDIERACAAIEALPWVAEASVSRHWPDALGITVTEQRAVARWNDSALLGADGEKFEVAGTAGMQGLARLYGPESRVGEVFATWRGMKSRLSAEGLEIVRLELDPRGAWTLELGAGRRLLLGREQIDRRLERYLAVRTQLRRRTDIRRIDLRYPNGLAVAREREPEEQLAGSGTGGTRESLPPRSRKPAMPRPGTDSLPTETKNAG
ncbi:MAG: FtsQ-type POTRA domain-containing protein [Wenzhouxiangellaceae bacterium]|nr:FtsQ-type POTRA domain-containing protein [Wenzhouxiangellaceae bacterium]